MWIIASEIGLGDISLAHIPSSTMVNSVFSISVRLFSQIVCPSVCISHYFLEKDNNLFGVFAGAFGGYYPGGPNA